MEALRPAKTTARSGCQCALHTLLWRGEEPAYMALAGRVRLREVRIEREDLEK